MASDLAASVTREKISGVYGIFNTANDKVYVGQSVDVWRRKVDHFSALVAGRHYNAHLQRAYSKYGAGFFEFRLIEACDEAVLDLREKAWISYYDSARGVGGYNSETGGHVGKHLSEQTKEKISEAKLGSKLSAETIAKRTASRRYWRPSPEHVAKLVAANRGREHSRDSIERGAAKRRGRKMSAASIEKMRRAHIGKPLSRQHAENIGAAHKGKKRSEAAKANMLAAQQRPEVREKQRAAQKARRDRERLERAGKNVP